MNEVVLKAEVTVCIQQVRVGQIAGQRCVVIPQRRAKQDWPRGLNCEVKRGPVASITIVNALRTAGS